jgi:anti-sigma factor RsiW
MTTRVVIDDSMLSAWLDDALDDDRRRMVQDALSEQPDMQQRLARLMLNERRVRDHFNAMLRDNPAPESMLALLDTSVSEAPAAVASRAPTRGSARPDWSEWIQYILPRPALAASAMAVVLAIGIVLGRQAGIDSPPAGLSTAAIEAGHEWFELLDATESGQVLALDNGQTGTVALTYRDVSGAWCRQFEVRDPARAMASAAIACRQQDSWRVELVQRVRLTGASDEYYQVASNQDLSALDTFISKGIDGDALAGAAELELIQSRWP